MDVRHDKPVNVEVLGISPHNKGALLMLEAVRERFQQELPNARLAVPFTWPADQRLRLGLHCTYPRERGRIDTARLSELLPLRLRKGVGLLSPSDVDVVLDASGFAYGDYWGLQKLQRRLVRTARHWKSGRNKTLILLPQALGPFDGPGMAAAWRVALRSADLVYVRDRGSMAYVNAAGAPADSVRLSPDFTNLLHPALPERLAAVRGAVLLIPNEKMVAGQDAARRAVYLDFLRCCAEHFLATGRQVLLLVHEGKGDRQLAAELNAMLPRPVEVLDEPSPLVTKAIIGAAHATVSSRFHGLISALSAAVPSAACGWTHKYGELMSDYGCADLNIDLSDRVSWTHKLDLLLQSAQDTAMREGLRRAAQEQKQRSEEMWASVFELLRRRYPAAA